jgi:hypothetical protein
MSYATVFKAGGDPYRVWSEVIDKLADGLQNVARKVFGCIVRKELDGKLDTEKPTDREIGQELGIAPRTVQKALHALDTDVLEVNDGQPLIDRESGLGCHGRRKISLTVGLAKSRDAPARSPATCAGIPAEGPPPQTPPELGEILQNTTTEGGSSSSPEKAPEKTPDPTDPVVAELLARAGALVPDVTAGILAHAVATYSADWVRQALGVAEERNRTAQSRGKHRVKGWSFIRGILENWRTEGGPPPEKPAPPVPVPKAPAEPSAPLPKLLPEQLAEMLERSRQGPQALRNLAVSQIRRAILDGQVPPELMATIPAEIRAGSEVPAAVSG